MHKLTLAITHYNRYEMLRESFAEVLFDDRIDEILIMDDASDEKVLSKLRLLEQQYDKIKVMVQINNRGMMRNKRDAVFYSKNPWVILFDSDNIIKTDYLDAIPEQLSPTTIYMPDYAWPNFDYRKFDHEVIHKYNAGRLIDDPMGNCCINTCNYLVNREKYLEVWGENPRIKASDTIYFNYRWLKAGFDFKIVANMHYFHRVHEGSGFLKDVEYNMSLATQIGHDIKQLKWSQFDSKED